MTIYLVTKHQLMVLTSFEFRICLRSLSLLYIKAIQFHLAMVTNIHYRIYNNTRDTDIQ